MNTICHIFCLTVLLIACSNEERECRFGSDCQSGECSSTGICLSPEESDDQLETDPQEEAGSGSDHQAGDDGGAHLEGHDLGNGRGHERDSETSSVDMSQGGRDMGSSAEDMNHQETDMSDMTDQTLEGAPDMSGGSEQCWPDHNNQIDLTEFPAIPGVVQTYLKATDVRVDTSGDDWDLLPSLMNEQQITVRLEVIDDQWFAPTFPEATYVAPIAGEETLLGVYELTESQLLLRGVVSESEEFHLKTELIYTPPALIMSFPLEVGDSWESTSTITGLYPLGVAYYFETHSSEVDTQGMMNTPLADFEVIRVNSQLIRTVGFGMNTRRNHFYIAECFGVVANLTSHDDEPARLFSEAAEVRVITP